MSIQEYVTRRKTRAFNSEIIPVLLLGNQKPTLVVGWMWPGILINYLEELLLQRIAENFLIITYLNVAKIV